MDVLEQGRAPGQELSPSTLCFAGSHPQQKPPAAQSQCCLLALGSHSSKALLSPGWQRCPEEPELLAELPPRLQTTRELWKTTVSSGWPRVQGS